MISQFKRRVSKEIYGNQNYLNFIKKNHQLIQNQLNGQTQRQSSINQHQNNHNYNSYTFTIKGESPNHPSSKQSKRDKKAIHDSLSKFKLSGNSQTLGTYNTGDHLEDHMYSDSLKKNDQIAATLINNKIVLSNKKKTLRVEPNKQILFHLNKNRSMNSKKVQLKKVQFDRYQSIPEPTVQLNLKFPTIEKKNMATLELQRDKMPFLDQLRSRMKLIERRQKTDEHLQQVLDLSPKQQYHHEYSLVNSICEPGQKNSHSKARDELYGLLPSFRSPHIISDHKKRHKLHKNVKLKIEIGRDSSIKEIVGQYLQNNIITKSIPISQKKIGKEKIIFNKEILDATILHNREELDLIENLNEEDVKLPNSTENLEINRQNQTSHELEHKVRSKKQTPLELKYQGDFSIYDIKIRSYRQFLFMVNLAHRIYDPIILKDVNGFKPEHRYKFYLGKGNNYLLVKSLLKRRFWWTVEEDPKKANFAWTQLKLNYFFQYQKKTEKTQKNHKLDKNFQSPSSPKKKKKPKNNQEQKQPLKAGAFKPPLPPNDKKIFTSSDKKFYDDFLLKADNPQKLLKFSNRLKYFDENFFRNRVGDIYAQRVHNHLQFNYFIGNKKALFYSLKQYYELMHKNVFDIIPLTFHIKHGTADPQYQVFRKEFSRFAKQKLTKKTLKNVWIVKPGELSNRGQGITVIDEVYQLNTILKKKEKHFNGTEKTYIVQKYIEKPLLYKGRKFDIRHYMMISRLHGVMRAYWFGEGYIRTSSYQFNIDDIGEEIIHLTNDAIQKYCEGYGKYQQGNKVSYNQFQRYMDSTYGQNKFSFSDMIYPKMKQIALDAVKATYLQLDTHNKEHNFEIFGLDFMIDINFNVWLIEVNTNPCLQLSSKLLARLIPTMVEQSLRLTLDVIFPPPTHYPNSQKYLAPDNPLQRLQYELIFDQDRDGAQIEALFANAKKVDMGQVDQQDETYENDGKQIELDNEIQ